MSSSDDLNIENYEEYFHSLIEKIKKIFVKKVNKLYSDTLKEKIFKNIEEFIQINDLDLTFELPLEINIFEKLEVSIFKNMKKEINNNFASNQSEIFNKGIRLNLFYKRFDKLIINSNLEEETRIYLIAQNIFN
jgi:hypothetical protein